MATPNTVVTVNDNNALPVAGKDTKANALPGKTKAFVDKHKVQKIDKMGDKGSEENQFTAGSVKKDDTKKASYHAGADAQVYEETMSDSEKSKRERIVKGMKKNAADFKSKYGDRWKSVMYATATKAAMESVDLEEGMPSSVAKSKQKYSEMSDDEFAEKHGSKSEAELKAMAWRHGYGKDSSVYVNKVKKGSKMAEETDLSEGTGKYFATAEKSQFKDGWRAHLKNPQGKTSYMSSDAFKNKADAIAHAAAYHQHVNVKGLNSDTMKRPDKSKLAESVEVSVGKRIASAILSGIQSESFKLTEEDGRRLRDNLKSEGKHEEAGAVAHKHGLGRSYGPHFGMRSSKNSAEAAFHRGYDKAAAAAKGSVKEEVEQIDEISKSTLGSYATKALRRGDIAARMSHSDTDDMGKIAAKRLAGVKKAVDKIAPKKTATAIKSNIDKAKEAAKNRHTDKDDQGKAYYAAQKGIAKVRENVENELLNKLYESLNDSNKRLMDIMLEDGRVDELLELAMEKFNGDV